MSKQEVKKQSRIKTKKKAWFKIVAPAVFGKRELGETYVTSAESAMGGMLKINLKDRCYQFLLIRVDSLMF